jgi:glycosyltransferase involved in cell wall biosynthesis
MQDHTRTLAAGLVRAGHDVEVIADRHPDRLPCEKIEGVRWHYLPYPSRQDRLPRRDRRWLRASYDQFLRLEGAKAFDVIHSESTSAIELVKHGVHRRVPVVVNFHGNSISLRRATRRRFREGDREARVREAKGFVWVLGTKFQQGHWYRFRSCHWIVPSRSEFEDTRRDALMKRELGHVVPNGVDVSVFRPQERSEARRQLGLPDGPLFVCVGRLEPDKGFGRAIEALRVLRSAISARLVVVGEGPERRPLESLAHELGVGDQVAFTGPVRHDAVARYMAAADAFLFPTERAEAAPLVLPQAMACGAAVVASEIGSIAEVVEPEAGAALLVRPGDVEALAGAMERLLADEPLRARLGKAARRRVLSEYSLERMVERTLAVYETALADARDRAAA